MAIRHQAPQLSEPEALKGPAHNMPEVHVRCRIGTEPIFFNSWYSDQAEKRVPTLAPLACPERVSGPA